MRKCKCDRPTRKIDWRSAAPDSVDRAYDEISRPVKGRRVTPSSWRSKGGHRSVGKMLVTVLYRFRGSLSYDDNREVSDNTRSERRAGNGSPCKVGLELHRAEFRKHR
jgi:hypothetical protein